MNLHAGIARTLIVFLALRAAAAPIALRHDLPTPASPHRFVIRVCAWAAQRPQHLTTAQAFLARSRDRRRGAAASLRPGQPGHAADQLTCACRPFKTLVARSKVPSVHLSDCPRC
jgi:hypothetical protein